MKKLMLLLVWACLANIANSQTAIRPYDLDDLKLEVAEYFKVPVSNVTYLEIRKYGLDPFLYAKLTKDTTPITWITGLSGNPEGGIPFIGGSITCAGRGCAECDIDGKKIEDMYCTCKRQVGEGGYCDMTKTIGAGNQ